MRKPILTDTYETDVNTPRAIGDVLALGSPWYLYGRYFATVFKGWLLNLRGRYDRAAYIEMGYSVFETVERCNGRFHITGLDNLRNCHEPVVIVSNHMSSLENNIFLYLIGPFLPITFVVKESLLKYPIFGPILKSQDPIGVTRKDARSDLKLVMEEGVERLDNGRSVIVYPQGTRTTSFDATTFNSLGVRLARKASVKVIPVAIKTDFWQNGRFLRDFGPLHRHKPIHFAFGEPLPVSNVKQTHQQILQFIESNLAEWQSGRVAK